MVQMKFADYVEMLNDLLAKYDLAPVTIEQIVGVEAPPP